MNIKKNISTFFFLVVFFFLALFLRIYRLAEIPPGVRDDEADYGYDALLLSQSGKDQWGKFLPLEFRGFGDWRLPVTQYLIVPLVRFFGLNSFVIRLPTVIFSSLTVLMIYLLTRKFFSGDKHAKIIGFFAAILLAFNPWHFSLSRLVMEANIGLFFVLLSIYFYLESRDNVKSFFLAAACAVISFYTYYGYRLFLPLYLIVLTIREQNLIIKNVSRKLVILFLGILLMIPSIVSIKEGGLARLKQVNFWQEKNLVGEVNQYRAECQNNINPLICKLFFNKPILIMEKFFINYFNHFSLNFLFFPEFQKGWSYLPSSSSFFYFLDLIPFIMGVLFLFKGKKNYNILLFLVLAPIADSLTSQGGGSFTRNLTMVIPLLIVMAYGWCKIFTLAKSKILVYLFVSFNIYFCLGFFINYFIYFPKNHSLYTHFEYQPLFEYLKRVEENYDHIYISNVWHDQRQYIFYLYYFQIPAQKYFKLEKDYLVENNGWVWVKKIGKFSFINQAYQLSEYPPKSLLVIDPHGISGISGLTKPAAEIKYLDDKIAFDIFDIDKIKEEGKQLNSNEL